SLASRESSSKHLTIPLRVSMVLVLYIREGIIHWVGQTAGAISLMGWYLEGMWDVYGRRLGPNDQM
ncbi:MAG: hypothetical protein QHH07_12895, partial [Sedimentisphaerales bacterium]|nr:hypothetical protein [Sedimentisphaerales bacterium]